jgi:hypothetical protein
MCTQTCMPTSSAWRVGSGEALGKAEPLEERMVLGMGVGPLRPEGKEGAGRRVLPLGYRPQPMGCDMPIPRGRGKHLTRAGPWVHSSFWL